MSDGTAIALAGMITTIAGFLFQAYLLLINRRWAEKDRQRIADESNRRDQTSAALVKAGTAVAQQSSDHSKAALDVANDVNNKIAALGLAHNQLQAERQQDARAANTDQLDRIEATGEDTHGLVKENLKGTP